MTEIVIQILKLKSQRVLFSGIVVTLALEFVNVMKGNRGIYDKYTYYKIAREHPLFSYITISIFHFNQANLLIFVDYRHHILLQKILQLNSLSLLIFYAI